MHPTDGDREVMLVDDQEVGLADEEPTLPTQTRDDTVYGWGERPESNDARLLAERPPHWD